MMEIPWVYDLPLWVSAVVFVLVLSLALEAGFHAGFRQRRTTEAPEEMSRGDVTLSSMLALLGLMLAFTYAFTLSRADWRKDATLEEANAIGTAFLKASFLPEPGRREVRKALLDYARTRIITHEETKDRHARKALMARTLEAQAKLWPALERALQNQTLGPYGTSLLQAVTAVLDAHTTRVTAAFDRMPAVVSLLLLAIAALSLAIAGHNAGLSGRINRGRMYGFVLILAALMLVILDFDRPQTGVIRLNNAPITAVVDDMERALMD
jgi:hypothetical protein